MPCRVHAARGIRLFTNLYRILMIMHRRTSDTPADGRQRLGKKDKLPFSFQDEQEIIDLVADVHKGDIFFFPSETKRGLRFLSSLRARSFDQRESPDFEDVPASLLLEAMIVDDHPRNIGGKKDVTRGRQSEVRRELIDAGWDQLAPNATLFANVSSGLPTDLDHSYRAYVEHFTRTVTAHANKVRVYRSERPGFELGFLILDESTAYHETAGTFAATSGDRMHFWFTDAAFLDALRESGTDCVAWATPYKLSLKRNIGISPLPELTIIDVPLLSRITAETYNPARMRSVEV